MTMDRRMRSLAAVLVVAGTALFPPTLEAQLIATGPATPLEERIIELSEAWATAVAENDLETIEAFMADDFLLVQATPRGIAIVGKDTQLENLRRRPAGAPAAARTLEQITVRTYGGDTAILTAVATYSAQGSAPGIEPLTTQAVITEVWTNDGAGWRLSHFQPLTGPAGTN
jgi:uncharacterized protein (TIGR02246 family)